MGNLKKVLALSLVFALVLSFGMSAFAATSSKDLADAKDVDAAYAEYVDFVIENNIMIGSDNKFSPKGNLNRQDMAIVIAIMDCKNDGTDYNSVLEDFKNVKGFEDVPAGAYYAGAVNYLKFKKITVGTVINGKSYFKPKEKATFFDTAIFTAISAGYVPANHKADTADLAYQDVAKYFAMKTGVLGKVPAGEAITREQTAKMVNLVANTKIPDYAPLADGTWSCKQLDKTLLAKWNELSDVKTVTGRLLSNKYAGTSSFPKGAVKVQLYNANKNAADVVTINVTSDSQVPTELIGRVIKISAKEAYSNVYNAVGTAKATDSVAEIPLTGTADDYENLKELSITGSTKVYNNFASASLTSLRTSNDTWAKLFTKANYAKAVAVRVFGENQFDTIFTTKYSFAKVTKVAADGKVTATDIHNANIKVIDAVDAANFEFGKTLKVDDVIRVVMNDKTPVSAKVLDVMSGTVTRFNGSKAIIDGTEYAVYDLAVGSTAFASDLPNTIAGKQQVEIQYALESSMIVYFKAPSDPEVVKNYGFVTAIDKSGPNYYATVLKTDGTTIEKIVASYTPKDGSKTTSISINNTATSLANQDGISPLKDTDPNVVLFSYTIDENDKLVLVAEQDQVRATTSSFVKGSQLFTGNNVNKTVTANTNFVLAYNDKFAAGVGNSTDTFAAGNEKSAVFVDGNNVICAYVRIASDKPAVASNADVYAIITSNISVAVVDGKNQISFTAYNLKTKESKDYTVTPGKVLNDADYVSYAKAVANLPKGRLLKVAITDDVITRMDSVTMNNPVAAPVKNTPYTFTAAPAIAEAGGVVTKGSADITTGFAGLLTTTETKFYKLSGGTLTEINLADASAVTAVAVNGSYGFTLIGDTDNLAQVIVINVA